MRACSASSVAIRLVTLCDAAVLASLGRSEACERIGLHAASFQHAVTAATSCEGVSRTGALLRAVVKVVVLHAIGFAGLRQDCACIPGDPLPAPTTCCP